MAADEKLYQPYEPTAAIVTEPPVAPAEPVAWLLWPARVVAFCVVLPVRLAWAALRGAARAVGAALERSFAVLGRALVAVLRPVVTALLAPLRWLGRTLLLPLAAGVGALFVWSSQRLVGPLLRAVAVVLRAIGRGLAAARSVVAGIVVAVLRALGGAASAALAAGRRALAAVVRFLGQVLRMLVLRPLAALLGLLTAGAGLLGRTLAAPLVLLWRWVLRPVGSAIAIALVAVAMGAWRFLLQPLARGAGAALRAVADAVGWAWHTSGRVLAYAGRALAWPFVWLYRHVLTPVGHAIRAVWRAVVVAPWRAVRRTTSAAAAAVRTSVRDARRQAGNQVRRALGRPAR